MYKNVLLKSRRENIMECAEGENRAFHSQGECGCSVSPSPATLDSVLSSGPQSLYSLALWTTDPTLRLEDSLLWRRTGSSALIFHLHNPLLFCPRNTLRFYTCMREWAGSGYLPLKLRVWSISSLHLEFPLTLTSCPITLRLSRFTIFEGWFWFSILSSWAIRTQFSTSWVLWG